MAKRNRGMTATKLRILLTTCLVLIFALAVAGFLYARTHISNYSSEVSAKSSEAEASRSRVQELQQTERELDERTEVRERAEQIVAESKSYQYQDQIVRDITSYASKAGITINGFSFSAADSTGTAGATPAPAPVAEAPIGAEPGIEGAAPLAAPAPALKSTAVVINIDSDVNYKNLLQFMTMIEQNLTKMQIANISLSRSSEGGAESVSTQALNLEVYIR